MVCKLSEILDVGSKLQSLVAKPKMWLAKPRTRRGDVACQAPNLKTRCWLRNPTPQRNMLAGKPETLKGDVGCCRAESPYWRYWLGNPKNPKTKCCLQYTGLVVFRLTSRLLFCNRTCGDALTCFIPKEISSKKSKMDVLIFWTTFTHVFGESVCSSRCSKNSADSVVASDWQQRGSARNACASHIAMFSR